MRSFKLTPTLTMVLLLRAQLLKNSVYGSAQSSSMSALVRVVRPSPSLNGKHGVRVLIIDDTNILASRIDIRCAERLND